LGNFASDGGIFLVKNLANFAFPSSRAFVALSLLFLSFSRGARKAGKRTEKDVESKKNSDCTV
jgi:hypothetical protein